MHVFNTFILNLPTMKLKYFLFATIIFLTSLFPLNATVWNVGVSLTYSLPSQVVPLVSDGDTVDIAAGIYNSDVCNWSKNNLLLRCTNGKAHMKSNGLSYLGKGIWVIQGNNTTVDNIEFSLCSSQDGNAAGIRLVGKNLLVKNCYFHHNQMGILSDGISQSVVRIEFSEFNNNGTNDGLTHNVYIGKVDSLIFRFNYVHHNQGGCEVKSRAMVNYILYNRISSESTGTSGNELQISNGGLAIVMGNIIQQSATTTNSGIIFFGTEGLLNPAPHNLYLINNTIVNEKTSGTFVTINNGTAIYKNRNNVFAGAGNLLSGSATTIDTLSNRQFSLTGAGFLNLSIYDYHLLPGSPAINLGTSAGVASSGFPLSPQYQYVHPAGQQTRSGRQDIGAYERGGIMSISENRALNSLNAYINNGQLNISSDSELNLVILLSADGKVLYNNATPVKATQISTTNFPIGIYILLVSDTSGYHYKKLLIN